MRKRRGFGLIYCVNYVMINKKRDNMFVLQEINSPEGVDVYALYHQWKEYWSNPGFENGSTGQDRKTGAVFWTGYRDSRYTNRRKRKKEDKENNNKKKGCP